MSERVVPEPRRRRRRPTKQGVVLSQELIIDTALRLIEQHGAEALTVRRLGAALGADPSAVYRYFHSTDDLLLAIADELIGLAQADWRATGDWRADLRAIGLRIHSAYLAHPQAAVLAAHRTTGRTHETAAVEAILSVLRTAGFPDQEAVRIYHAFVDQSLGFAALDAAALALPAAAATADLRVWQSSYARLDATTHPHIAATAHLLTADMRSSGYPYALDLLIDAAGARLAALR
ncbi:TetR/AcrR family transcriptional regulator [Kitasatospora aureofaciens]|uniref:TetR family transcriptional regulator n=1 Tax=Kitasatospora aureofaciens TaxID=1894 RepID=A0A1E7NEZ3_KITAU|nr:TetR family transcriptional regulator [Kitasatospora aureofaciens]QEV03182.1 TetR/AcrR family transcriptional regulator [Streptomyces viridifaciens]ARF82473.1 TetR family transcriptional regulator [Kitasatospora aureofaciens]OEV39276.1 TetR family transcriptional regulator [Kitasatospora aureofaciens]UKZ09847.1 TetR/AcrR family transcriptional regulator [Streptomyces viridifaciens]HJD82334.1 TetR/AcrR family transcriptional regulator [Kitasatospora aureofaciens]